MKQHINKRTVYAILILSLAIASLFFIFQGNLQQSLADMRCRALTGSNQAFTYIQHYTDDPQSRYSYICAPSVGSYPYGWILPNGTVMTDSSAIDRYYQGG